MYESKALWSEKRKIMSEGNKKRKLFSFICVVVFLYIFNLIHINEHNDLFLSFPITATVGLHALRMQNVQNKQE